MNIWRTGKAAPRSKAGRWGKLMSVTLSLLLYTCVGNRTGSQPVTIDWPAVFHSLKPGEPGTFTIRNTSQLDIPQRGRSFHQQGIQRLPNGGWAVSGSGAESGYLYFTEPDGTIHTVFRIPADLDLAGMAAELKYNHPGGFQICGQFLAVGLENTDLRRDSYSRVVFLDISNPHRPKHLSHLDIVRPAVPGEVMTAGAVALTELADSYLIVVGNWDSRRLDFYRTSSKKLRNKKTTVSGRLGSWTQEPTVHPYQNINAYGGSPDQIYLIGLYSPDRTEDRSELLAFDLRNQDQILLLQRWEHAFRGGREEPGFIHGAGTWWDSDQGQLWHYAVEADGEKADIYGNLWLSK